MRAVNRVEDPIRNTVMQKTFKISAVVATLMLAAGLYTYTTYEKSPEKLLTPEEIGALQEVEKLYESDGFDRYDEVFANLPILEELSPNIQAEAKLVESLQMVKAEDFWVLEVYYLSEDNEKMTLLKLNEINSDSLITLVKDRQNEIYLVK